MKAWWVAGGLAVALAGCAHGQTSAGRSAHSETVVISLQEIACQSCGQASARALTKREGVEKATFDRDTAEVTVHYDPAVTSPPALVGVVGELGYEAEVGSGKGRYLPEVDFPEELDVVWTSRDGTAVEIEEHRVPGKITVFDFYAPWCGPCREVDREMLSILKNRTDVALRKLNVVDWESGVAKRYLKDIPHLPYVIVYGKNGERLRVISGLHLDQLRAAIREARSGL